MFEQLMENLSKSFYKSTGGTVDKAIKGYITYSVQNKFLPSPNLDPYISNIYCKTKIYPNFSGLFFKYRIISKGNMQETVSHFLFKSVPNQWWHYNGTPFKVVMQRVLF